MEEDEREGRLISFHQPRIWLMCTVCGKRFSECPSVVKKRLTRSNLDQCCSEPCRTLYSMGKYTDEGKALALEHNLAVKARMVKDGVIKAEPL